MKETLLNILDEYLKYYPNELNLQQKLKEFLLLSPSESITDWNNFDGHIVVGGFVYALKEQKFLLLHHKDLNMYLYPGGHIDKDDKTTLDTAKREIYEETGLTDLKQILVTDNPLIPFDIDTHFIEYNHRLNLPEHYHYDFRYLFTINKITDVKIDESESSTYKWVEVEELSKNTNYQKIILKIENLLNNKNIP